MAKKKVEESKVAENIAKKKATTKQEVAVATKEIKTPTKKATKKTKLVEEKKVVISTLETINDNKKRTTKKKKEDNEESVVENAEPKTKKKIINKKEGPIEGTQIAEIVPQKTTKKKKEDNEENVVKNAEPKSKKKIAKKKESPIEDTQIAEIVPQKTTKKKKEDNEENVVKNAELKSKKKAKAETKVELPPKHIAETEIKKSEHIPIPIVKRPIAVLQNKEEKSEPLADVPFNEVETDARTLRLREKRRKQRQNRKLRKQQQKQLTNPQTPPSQKTQPTKKQLRVPTPTNSKPEEIPVNKPISNRAEEIKNIQPNKHTKIIPPVDLSQFEDEKPARIIKNANDSFVPPNAEKLLSITALRTPYYQNFFRSIEHFIVNEMLVSVGQTVMVAVSGGVDSVALLDVMANLSSKYRFNVVTCTFDHTLRGEQSKQDAMYVKQLSESYNIPCYISRGQVAQYAEKNKMSVEEAARIMRYAFFERAARTMGADFLATAHTSDDSAETFLLNLIRGTGLTGLSGIPAKRQMLKDILIVRPFLTLPKSQIIEYAKKRELVWNEDETNAQEKYTRNKIRLSLIPKLKEFSPAIVDIINRAAKLMQGADRFIHDYVRTHLPSIIAEVTDSSVSIKLPLLKTFDNFIQGEMLQAILMKYFRMQAPTMKLIDRIMKLENSEVGATTPITHNIFAIKDRQVLSIARKKTSNINLQIKKKGKKWDKYPILGNTSIIISEINNNEMKFDENPSVEYFDADKIPNVLTLRNWAFGDEFQPLGMTGTMKVSDFLTNEKISVLERPNTLVLVAVNNQIIWVCQKRISEKFKVGPKTKSILKMEIRNVK